MRASAATVFVCLFAVGAVAQTVTSPDSIMRLHAASQAAGTGGDIRTNSISAADVSAGGFGGTSVGNYTFPGTLTIGVPAGTILNPAVQLYVRETDSTNEQAVFTNNGTYHTGIAFTATSNHLSDAAAWGLYGGPNQYLTGVPYRVAVILPQAVPDFSIMTGAPNLNQQATPRFTVKQDGKVGVGTTAPAAQLHVHTTADVNEQAVFSNAGTRHTGLSFTSTTAHLTDPKAWGIYGGPNNYLTGLADRVALVLPQGVPDFSIMTGGVSVNTQGTQRFTVTQAGNVGIGVPNPTVKLAVAGDIVASGSITGATVINATFQDLAEWVPATTDMLPGTVVVLNPDKENEVMASGRPYDSMVAGVVSEQPGILLGVGSDTKEQVATTGRVRVRVDATSAPIRIGDLLVTSSKTGMAMRSEPMSLSGRELHQPGTILGKALQPLESGEGQILVLLSLQ